MNKTICVTGASSGIGLAIAELFASNGYNLIISARRIEKLIEIKNEFEAKYKIEVFAESLDVRNYNEVQSFFQKVFEKFEKIDILVNNAGLARGLEKFQDGVLENWDEMIDTNIKGLIYVSRNVLPKMIEQKDGMIINIGSIAGRELYPSGNVYCGSKHFVAAVTKGMIIDLNGTGVRVCNIEPGMVETDFSLVRFRGDSERAEKVYQGLEPLRGEDIAEIAYFVSQTPKHVMIQDILVTPTAQASASIISRNL
jgi:3-hydroxy acid dehydrogenase/malonic semialdehyde reductase